MSRDAGSPFLLLAWASPAYQGKIGLEPLLETRTLERSRVYCIEAIGTTVACFNVTLRSQTENKRVYGMEPKRSYLCRPDVDVLDSARFLRFVSHVQRARRAIHVPWEDPQTDLNGILLPSAAELLNTLRVKYSSLINISYHTRALPHAHKHVSQSAYELCNRPFLWT